MGNKEANRASVLVIDALISRMDSILIINILIPVLDAHGEESEIKQACLNTLKSVLDKCAVGSLNNDIVDNIMPSILQCYESSLSNTRKSACLPRFSSSGHRKRRAAATATVLTARQIEAPAAVHQKAEKWLKENIKNKLKKKN